MKFETWNRCDALVHMHAAVGYLSKRLWCARYEAAGIDGLHGSAKATGLRFRWALDDCTGRICKQLTPLCGACATADDQDPFSRFAGEYEIEPVQYAEGDAFNRGTY